MNCIYLFIMYPTCNTYFTHIILPYLITLITSVRRSQWPYGLTCGSVAARLLKLWFRIPPGAWMFFCGECRVLSGWGLCDELITLPKESYRLWCFVECDLETPRMRRPWLIGGLLRQKKLYIIAAVVLFVMDTKRICTHIGILPSRHVDVSYLAPSPTEKKNW